MRFSEWPPLNPRTRGRLGQLPGPCLCVFACKCLHTDTQRERLAFKWPYLWVVILAHQVSFFFFFFLLLVFHFSHILHLDPKSFISCIHFTLKADKISAALTCNVCHVCSGASQNSDRCQMTHVEAEMNEKRRSK